MKDDLVKNQSSPPPCKKKESIPKFSLFLSPVITLLCI